MQREKFLDDWRGVALAAMVINHVGHYLSAEPLASGIYLLIYWSVTVAAPVFLFIAGAAAALSDRRQSAALSPFQRLLKSWRRAAILLLCGYAVNLLFFAGEPWYRSRILFTLAAASFISYPLLRLMRRRFGGWLMIAAASAILLSCQWWAGAMFDFYRSWPLVWEIIGGEFPLLPWLGVYALGLVAGGYYASLNLASRDRLAQYLGIGGAIAIIIWIILSVSGGRQALFNFAFDLNFQHYWLPAAITWFWIFGWIMLGWCCLWQYRRYFPCGDNPLTILGLNALPAYFLHLFIIRGLGEKWLSLSAGSLELSLLFSLVIILILWLILKSKAFAKLMASVPASLRGRTS